MRDDMPLMLISKRLISTPYELTAHYLKMLDSRFYARAAFDAATCRDRVITLLHERLALFNFLNA